jgi:HD-GYP domain-containing protein (c-di-GMP phosphodiesterase class II)
MRSPPPRERTLGDEDLAARRRLAGLGRRLVSHFFVLLKAAQLYEPRNTIVVEAMETFRSTLSDLLDDTPEAVLRLRAECLFLNEARLRLDLAGFVAHRFLVETLRRRGVGAVRFYRLPEPEELRRFLAVFLKGGTDVEDLRAALAAHELDMFDLDPMKDDDDELPGQVSDQSEAAVDTYFKSIFVIRQIMTERDSRRSPALRRAKKVVHAIVDLLFEEEASLLALTAIRSFDDRTFNHSANVCILSVAAGRELGLDKRDLGRLGLAALLHDIGKIEIPRDLLRKGSELSTEERTILERHPMEGVKALLRFQGLSDLSVRCAVVAFEHHILRDGRGYPTKIRQRDPGLLSRIVTIADFYETLTAPGALTEEGIPPEEALRLMVSARAFDPTLLKVFISAIGTVPIGSLVRLSTGEEAIVTARDEEGGRRPVVALLLEGADGRRKLGSTVDLASPEAGDREIVQVAPLGQSYADPDEVLGLVAAGH